jgi:hypothetical protein
MTIPYSSGKTLSIDQLTNVNITDIANNNLLQYNSTNGEWSNGNDINIDEIDARVLRITETADVGGRLANQGVASFVNDEFIFQNGISNLGDTIYIDNVNTRVGIGISNPEEDLEVCGSIQIDSANVARLKFQQTGQDPHSLGEIDGEQDGTNGGDLQFYTKVDGGSVSEKLRINNIGAISIGGGANYGTTGQVLTSNGSTSSVSWTTPSGGGGGITSFAFMALSVSQQVLVIKPTFDVLEFDITRTTDPTGNIVLDTTTNIGRVNITDAGTYKIDIALTGDTAGTNRIVVIGQLYVNGVADTNCICYSYCRDQNHGENTGNINAILTLPANSYLELQVSRNSSTQAFVIVGTNIAIMKIA